MNLDFFSAAIAASFNNPVTVNGQPYEIKTNVTGGNLKRKICL